VLALGIMPGERQRLCGSTLAYSGEGPGQATATLTSINGTSMQGIWPILENKNPSDLICHQEVRVQDLEWWVAEAGEHKWQLELLPIADVVPLSACYAKRACLSSWEVPTLEVMAGRVQVYEWHLEQGPPTTVAQVYGHSKPKVRQK
jgi:hypothetical protein